MAQACEKRLFRTAIADLSARTSSVLPEAVGVSPMRANHHLTATLAFVMLMNREKPPGWAGGWTFQSTYPVDG